MICSNCGFMEKDHVRIDGKLLCIQKAGVYATQIERYDCIVERTDPKGVTDSVNLPVLEKDDTRVHVAIIRLLEQGYTGIKVSVVEHDVKGADKEKKKPPKKPL